MSRQQTAKDALDGRDANAQGLRTLGSGRVVVCAAERLPGVRRKEEQQKQQLTRAARPLWCPEAAHLVMSASCQFGSVRMMRGPRWSDDTHNSDIEASSLSFTSTFRRSGDRWMLAVRV